MLAIFGHLFDPVTLLAMLAGIGLVALFQNGVGAMGRAFGALRPLLRADPVRDRDAARAAMLQIDQVAQLRGLSCTGEDRQHLPDRGRPQARQLRP